MGKDKDKIKISKKKEKSYVLAAVLRSGGYSRKELEAKDKEELYKLRVAALKRMLSQFDEMRINNGGTLTDREQGYQAYYAEELEFLQSDDSMDWLKKCMGVVLKHTDIEHYHKLDEKQRRKLRKNRIIESLTEQAKGGTKYEAKMSALKLVDSKPETSAGDDFASPPPAKKAKPESPPES